MNSFSFCDELFGRFRLTGFIFEFAILSVKSNGTVKSAFFHNFGDRTIFFGNHFDGFLHTNLIEISFKRHSHAFVEQVAASSFRISEVFRHRLQTYLICVVCVYIIDKIYGFFVRNEGFLFRKRIGFQKRVEKQIRISAVYEVCFFFYFQPVV